MSDLDKYQCRHLTWIQYTSQPEASSMGRKFGFVPAVCIVKRQNHRAREEEEQRVLQRGVVEREGGGAATAGDVTRQAERHHTPIIRRPIRGNVRTPPWGSLLSCLSGVWSAGACCYGCGGGGLGAHSLDSFHTNPNTVTTWSLVDGGTPC